MMLRDLPPDHKRWLGGKALRHRLAKKFSHTIIRSQSETTLKNRVVSLCFCLFSAMPNLDFQAYCDHFLKNR